MKRYEYRVEPTGLPLHPSEVSERLNAIAKDGWRLVAVYGGLFIFERED